MNENALNSAQIAIVCTLWELAQGRIDALYTPESAEQEKQAVEAWMMRVFPNDYAEFVRAEGNRRNAG